MSDIVITVIAVIAGSLMCFEGYKLFRLSLGLAGGVAGFLIGRALINFTGNLGISWNLTGKLIVLILSTIVCAFWFYDDFSFLFEKVSSSALRLIFTFGAGLIAGALIGVIVYYAQKWTISLFTAFAGARVISGVLAPVLWSGLLSGEYAGIIEKRVLGADVGFNYSLVRVLLLVAFCAAGFAIQLKTYIF